MYLHEENVTYCDKHVSSRKCLFFVVSPQYDSNKKRNLEKHAEIFLEFLVFLNKQIESKNKKNSLHGKAPNKQKKNKKSFWVFFLIITTAWKVN